MEFIIYLLKKKNRNIFTAAFFAFFNKIFEKILKDGYGFLPPPPPLHGKIHFLEPSLTLHWPDLINAPCLNKFKFPVLVIKSC